MIRRSLSAQPLSPLGRCLPGAGALMTALLAGLPLQADTAPFGQVPADLRFEARFQHGEARADQGTGDLRMSRVFWLPDGTRLPDDGRGDRVSLPALVQPAPAERFAGDHVFEPRTEAAFRLPGHLNPQAGSLSVHVRRSDLFERGGELLSALASVAGGPRNGVHWVLGVSDTQRPNIPAGRLYLATGQVHCIANQPMPAGEWIHLAAVWDAERGARLYANGQKIGSTWQQRDQAGAELKEVFPEPGAPDVLHGWTLTRGTGPQRQRVRLTDDSPWDDVSFRRQAAPGGTDAGQPDAWHITSASADRLQLRSPQIRALPEGTYRLRVRYRQQRSDQAATDAAPHLDVRIGVQWPARGTPQWTRVRGAAPEGGAWQELEASFETPGPAHQATTSIDLNLTGPAHHQIAQVLVEKVDPVSGDLMPQHWSSNPLVMQAVPAPVQRLRLHPQPQPGALTHLRLYDAPLTADAVRALAEPGAPEAWPGMFEAPASPDHVWRQRLLGWDQDAKDWFPLTPAAPLHLREAVVERAYEDMRQAGHLAVDGRQSTAFPWWYHGYQQLDERRLHVVFTEPSPVNYLVTRGDLIGSVHPGGTPHEPQAPEIRMTFRGGLTTGPTRLQKTETYTSLTVVQQRGHLSHFHAYHLLDTPTALAPGRDYHLRGPVPAAVPLPEEKRAEMISSYRPEDRSYLVGHADAGDHAETRTLTPMRPVHFFSPAMEEDTALGAIRLRLHTRGLAAGSRLHVRVHDSFGLWREWGRFDFQLQETSAPENPLDLTLQLRPTLIRGGDALWLTLFFESEGELLSGPGAASRLTLHPTDRPLADRSFLEWELASWRDAFEALSEPRPWARISSPEDGWWLQAASPEYEHMVRVGQELLKRYPDEPRVQAWYQYIHPGMPNPAQDLPLPKPQGHPRWAELARENLKHYHHFAHWWTTRRAHPSGELGHFYGDDTDLLQDWADIALIHDPEGKLRQTVLRLTDRVWSDFTVRGRPIIVDGLNSRWTDALHAYEDGLNLSVIAFLLDYGNPQAFERLLATAARYDRHLLQRIDDHHVRFNSEGQGMVFFNAEEAPTGDPHHHWWFLPTHPGFALLWYSGHPTVQRLFTDLATWKLAGWDPANPYRLGSATASFFGGMYLATGEARYLPMLFDEAAWQTQGVLTPRATTADSFDASLVRRLDPASFDRQRTLTVSRTTAADRFDSLSTTALGWGERRHERNWLEWSLSGEKRYLEEGLEALYRRLTFTMPALTEAEQSGDRVSPPKQLISQMYLGGVVASRNHHFYPNFAVSYDGLSLDFAALVLETTRKTLRVLFYNFEEQTQHGGLRTWQLEPGRYQVRFGLDTTGNDRIDQELFVQKVQLKRASRLPLALPPGQQAVLEITQITPDPIPLHARADLAIAAEDVRWEPDGTLVVRVHNLGAAPAEAVEVRLSTTTGAVLARQHVARLEAPLDLQPKTADVRFSPSTFDATQPLVIEVDPENAIPQISESHLRLEIQR